MVTAKVKLTLHGSVLDRPVLHDASRLFDVPAVIRYADVGPYKGVLIVDMTGESADIEAVRLWLVDQGVIVEVIEQTGD